MKKSRGGSISVAIGENRTRRSYAALVREHGFELVNAIHPAAVVSATAVISHRQVTDVYLPLSRLLNLRVAATQSLQQTTDTFLGRPRQRSPFSD